MQIKACEPITLSTKLLFTPPLEKWVIPKIEQLYSSANLTNGVKDFLTSLALCISPSITHTIGSMMINLISEAVSKK